MTGLEQLDKDLRAFLENPNDFLAIMSFVTRLHGQPVLASSQPYALDIEGQKVTPVFTDVEDLEVFKSQQASARQQEWIERRTLEVLEEVIVKQLSGLVFNLKSSGDTGNRTIFKSSELIAFTNHYTTMLNQVMGTKNIEADLMDKVYLVPIFVHPNEDGSSDRLFPTMSTAEGESYLPVFSNVQSFAKWYQKEAFGGAFQKANGVVIAWTLQDIKQPESGENDLSETLGVVIDAFDQKHLRIFWKDIQ